MRSYRFVAEVTFKHFFNETFRKYLIDNLSNEVFVNNDDGIDMFCKISIVTLNKSAPRKTKYARAKCLP